MGGLVATPNPTRAAVLQRKRRQGFKRMDYMPSQRAQVAIEAVRSRHPANSVSATNSAVLNTIVLEWAAAAGVDCGPPEPKPERRRIPDPCLIWQPRKQQRGTARVVCGAKRHRDGEPCQALSEPGKRRCRFHGGRSTGPKTAEGKARCAANLPNGKRRDDG